MCHFLPFKYIYFNCRKLMTAVITSDFFFFFFFANLKTRIPNLSANFTITEEN